MAIVIIDDSMTNLVVLKHMAKSHCKKPIVMFSDADTALDYLTFEASELIIVDCEMPGIDGIAFIERVRQMDKHVSTPIMMVTHHTDANIRVRAFKAGSTDFLSKPVIPEEFKLRIANLIARTGPSRSVIPIDLDQAFRRCPIRRSD